MQRDEQVRAGLEADRASGAAVRNRGLERDERVDHRVADERDPLGVDALARQVARAPRASGEQQVRDLVGDDPVDLLGHRAVEAAQAGLDVADAGCSSLAAASAAASVELTSPGTITRSGSLASSTGSMPLHHARRLRRVRAGADAEQVVGLRHAELLEEDLRHRRVVVLPGVDEHVRAVRVGAAAARR